MKPPHQTHTLNTGPHVGAHPTPGDHVLRQNPDGLLGVRMTRPILFAIITVSGAAVLLLEVAATRLLAPYFGNSIYVLSSVLAVVLGFLSLGYWVGGTVSERVPPRRVLFGAIAGGGLGGLLISVLMITIMPVLGLTLPLTWGPLIASLLLFALPSSSLGMVAPSAVRLHPLAATAPARASGEVLAVSTLGSIGGSLAAGFLLLPLLGLRWTILGTAVVLLVLGAGGLGARKTRMERVIFLSTLLFAIPALAIPWTWFLPGVVHEKTSPYQHILVVDQGESPDGTATRHLIADYALMSGEVRDTGEPTFPYVRSMLVLIGALPRVGRVAVLGGGAFTLPRVLHDQHPDATIDAVDIDAALPPIARTYFRVAPDAHLRLHTRDGRRFLLTTTETYDVVVLDMYQSLAIPTHTMTAEFFSLLSSHLAPDGIVLMNIVGLPPDAQPSLALAVAQTAREKFPHQTLFKMPEWSSAIGNMLLIASAAPHLLHTADLRGIGTRLDLTPDRLASAPTFTDDRANTVPYEAALARALR